MATFSLEEVRAVCKSRDAWWTVLLVDPFAVRLTRIVANRTSITPNQLTVGAFALGMGAAGCFAQAGFGHGGRGWLLLGALLYHLGFVIDCVDGKVARLKGTGSAFGGWLDFMLDRVRDGLCALALGGGQYVATGQIAYLYLGFAILALDMLRYVNGPQIAKARRAMRDDLDALRGERKEPREATAGSRDDVDLQHGFSSRHPWYARIRGFLLRHRVRTHLISGVEFQMAVFIIGPLTGAIIPISAAAGALLLFFELALIYKFWLSSKEYTRAIGKPPKPRQVLQSTLAEQQ